MSRSNYVADVVRSAALGMAPPDVTSLSWWISPGPDGAFTAAANLCRGEVMSCNYLNGADETHARTFLLFVAEALS